MHNFFTVLEATLETRFWNAHDVSTWADLLIERIEFPHFWLIELSMAKTTKQAIGIIENAIDEFWIVLPGEIDDLLVGFTLLDYSKGTISEEKVKDEIIGIVDASGITELVISEISSLDLNDKIYNSFRDKADKSLDTIFSEKMLEENWNFFELSEGRR